MIFLVYIQSLIFLFIECFFFFFSLPLLTQKKKIKNEYKSVREKKKKFIY